MGPTERIGLALVATVGGRYSDAPAERLPDAAALGAWLRAHGLDVTDCTAHDLIQARELREAIFELVEAAVLRRPPRAAALTAVDTASRAAANRTLLWDNENGFHLGDGPATVAGALATIALDTADLLTGPDRDRLHQCEAESCGTVFVASPGGRARRWCSSATCGNRERVRAFRATREA